MGLTAYRVMANKKVPKPPDQGVDPREIGRYAYDGLARVIHEKSRLSILASLASHNDGLTFKDLKLMCSLTDGNLSRQLQVLQEAALVEIQKGYMNNRPQTVVNLTADGRVRFLKYIAVLENVVADATSASRKPARRSREMHGLSPS